MIKDIKLGMSVQTSSACAALGADGTVDLPVGTQGVVVSLKGEIAGISCGENSAIFYVKVDKLAA